MHDQIWPICGPNFLEEVTRADSTLESQLGSRITNPPADRTRNQKQTWSEPHTYSTCAGRSYHRVGRVAPAVLNRSCALVHVSAPRTVPEESDQPAVGETAAMAKGVDQRPASNWITRSLLRSLTHARALSLWRVERKVGAHGRCARRVWSGANERRKLRFIIRTC